LPAMAAVVAAQSSSWQEPLTEAAADVARHLVGTARGPRHASRHGGPGRRANRAPSLARCRDCGTPWAAQHPVCLACDTAPRCSHPPCSAPLLPRTHGGGTVRRYCTPRCQSAAWKAGRRTAGLPVG
jgi:hypothetical protein